MAKDSPQCLLASFESALQTSPAGKLPHELFYCQLLVGKVSQTTGAPTFGVGFCPCWLLLGPTLDSMETCFCHIDFTGEAPSVDCHRRFAGPASFQSSGAQCLFSAQLLCCGVFWEFTPCLCQNVFKAADDEAARSADPTERAPFPCR